MSISTRKIKREPLLIDRIVNGDTRAIDPTGILSKRLALRLRDKMLEAKRFVFDNEASEFVAEVVKDMPEVVVEAEQFAIPPFPLTYIEFPHPPYYKKLMGIDPDDKADHRIGALFDGINVYVFSQDRTGEVSIQPIKYTLNVHSDSKFPFHFAKAIRSNAKMFKEEHLRKMKEATGEEVDEKLMDEVVIEYVFWGLGFVTLRQRDKDDLLPELLKHGIGYVTGDRWENIPDSVKEWLGKEGFGYIAGDLKMLLAFLLVLNRTSDSQTVITEGPVRTMMRAKPSTLVSHSRVTFHLNPIPTIRRLVSGGIGTSWRREHDVRGHFCLSERARASGCTHEWVETGKRDRQWRCMRCSGLKWWRDSHRRGHVEKGVKTTEYRVAA